MASKFTVQLLETTSALITAAFGLVAALAWNTTITEAIKCYVPADQSGLTGYLIYAVLVTIIAVAATMLVANALAKAKESVDKAEQRKAARKGKKDSEEETSE